MANKINTYLKKGFKIFLWIIAGIIALFLLIVLLLQVPAVQNFAKDKAVTFLQDKIKTRVSLDKIEIGLPKKIILEGFYFEDQNKDTLLAGKKLAIDISLFKLLSNELEINSVSLDGIVANVSRNKDSVFNFDYIIDAFASEEVKEPSGEPMKILVNKINLDNIRLTFDDAISKNDIKVNLTHFDTQFNSFELDKMNFDIGKITLDGLKLRLDQGLVEQIAQTSVEVADTISKRPDFKIKLDEIALSKIDIGYDNAGSKLNTGLTLGSLLLKFNNIDLNRQKIDLENFEVKDLSGSLAFGKNTAQIKVPETDTTAIKSEGWKVNLNKTSLTNINFKFDDEGAPVTKKGIDYKHLDIKEFNLKGEKFYYSTDSISGNIASFRVSDKSGLDIQSLKTNFFYGPNGAYLKNLYIQTPQTVLRDEIVVKYPSIESISENLGELYIDAAINNSKIAFKDILTFVPTLEKTNPFNSNPNAVLFINSRISGKINDIKFPIFEISGIGTTRISASGSITGLPDVDKAYFDLRINNLRSTAKDINQFVPKGTIPANISLPPVFGLKGTFKGAVNNFNTNMQLVSSYGNANIKALFDQRTKNREKYNADVQLANFDLGKLIKNDSIGKISLKAKVNGTGLNPKTANAALRGILEKAEYNDYTYRNLKINGDINKGVFTADADMNDPNLTFNLVASGGFNDKYPSAKLKLNLDIADLNKLNLHAGPMKIRGNVDADIPTADPDFLNGKISLNKIQFVTDKDPIILDSINIISVSTIDSNSIKVRSQILKADIEGKYKLTQLATALQNSIAKYFDPNPNQIKQKTEAQQVAFNINIDNDPVIYQLFPQITGLEPINLVGRYDSVNDSIVLNGTIPRLVFGANTISGGNISVETKDDALVYNIDIDAIQNESFMLPFTSFSGEVKDDVVTYNLKIRDKEKKDQYAIAGTMKTVNGNTEIQLQPEGLVLNYEDWQIAADNLLRFGESGLYANNFELSNAGNTLKIQSESDRPNAPLEVNFTNFTIETILNMVKKDKALAGGIINGNVLIKDLMVNPVFTSDLQVTEFAFQGEPIGDISLKVNNQTADTYAANVAITGNGNQVNLDGFYKATAGTFDLNLDLQHFEMKSVQGFTFGNIEDGSGFLSGNFKVTGTAAQPRVVGELQFNDVGLRVTQLNSYFKSINEKIVFNDRGIFLDKFTVSDEKDNQLAINGAVLTTDYKQFGFDLTVDADNFRAVNSQAKDNDLYYGDLFLDTKLAIKGTLDSPVINGNIKINEHTKLSVVLPQSDPSIADREGIVEFVDEDNIMLQQTIAMEETMNETGVRGLDVSVNIEIVEEAELNLIIDKGNGDYLKLKGEADLTGGIDPSGKTTLTGKYEFSEGAYEMSFNFLKRKFDIKKGSSITWNGEPTSANVDITAVYVAETAPIDLLDDQLGSVSPSVRNTYKQKLPFEALLKINGELLKPTITFDIDLPDGNYNVSSDIVTASQNKLEQLRQEPAELNKQVFALLLLNRFIGENPFASEAGSAGAEGLARQSVSKILSQQLNNLAGDLVKGVELNFDLESTEDYTSGVKENRTDLNVGVSKRLLNDRLKVTVGSSFGLEGQEQANQEANNIAGDLAADYQLTKDGRYVVRAYRKNEYQVALQGQVIETGVAFVITMDYNQFRELFHRTQEEKDMRKRENERKEAQKEAEKNKEKLDTKAEKNDE